MDRVGRIILFVVVTVGLGLNLESIGENQKYPVHLVR